MTYQEFKSYNLGWDNGICRIDDSFSDRTMRKNWAIARNVRREFYRHYKRTLMEPQKGDAVEFVNGNTLYKHAAVEKVDRFGVMEICERASTHTDGKHFSTSGGSFTHKHKSHFEFAGYAYRRFWTWGCNGAGANQGIYFDILVKKFRQVGMPELSSEHRIFFHSPYYKDRPNCAVVVMKDWCYIFEEFETISRFKEWVNHIGLTYHKDEFGRYYTDQFLTDRRFCTMDEIPAGSRPIALMSNGTRVRGYVHNDGKTITFYRPNPNAEVYVPYAE